MELISMQYINIMGIIAFILIGITMFFLIMYTIYVVYNYIKIMLGYTNYRFTKITSQGKVIFHFKWFKSDDIALEYGENYQFVDDITNDISLKP